MTPLSNNSKPAPKTVGDLKMEQLEMLRAKGRGDSQLAKQLEHELSPEYEPDPVRLLAQMSYREKKQG